MVVSNGGPVTVAGMNLSGSGLLSFSSLLCHLISSSVTLEEADPPRPCFLGFADLYDAFPFFLDCVSSGDSESDEEDQGRGGGAEAH